MRAYYLISLQSRMKIYYKGHNKHADFWKLKFAHSNYKVVVVHSVSLIPDIIKVVAKKEKCVQKNFL